MIIAMCRDTNGIGFKGQLPWIYIKEDMRHFKNTTTFTGEHSNNEHIKNVIVMGRNTWDSLYHKPLTNRHHLILTTNKTEDDMITEQRLNKTFTNQRFEFVSSMDEILSFCDAYHCPHAWIIGGKQIYEWMFKQYSSILSECIITKIPQFYECDVFLDINQMINTDKHQWFLEKNELIQYTNPETKQMMDELLVIETWKNTFMIDTKNKLTQSQSQQYSPLIENTSKPAQTQPSHYCLIQ
jgi:dihydrofolate reductase